MSSNTLLKNWHKKLKSWLNIFITIQTKIRIKIYKNYRYFWDKIVPLKTKCASCRWHYKSRNKTPCCQLCDLHNTLPNLLICEQLAHVPKNGSKYADVFSQSVQTQKESMLQYQELLKEREGILKKREEANLTQDSGPLQGSNMDPLQDTIC